MDILSHGLWGGVAFGRKNKKSYWLSFLFGVLPDFFVFRPLFIQNIFLHGFEFGQPPDGITVPTYVYDRYEVTHSLVIFALVFCIVWLIRKRPLWELGAWGLHILVDIPTHSDRFFPTPFLWPLSDVHIDGHSWGTPEVFIPNVGALVFVYVLWWWRTRSKRESDLKSQSR